MRMLQSSFWKNWWKDSGLGEGDRLNCMVEGLVCEHISINLNEWHCCCASECECLCIRHSMCCLRGASFKQVGIMSNTTRGEFLRLSMPCCDCSIVRPRLLCGRASQCLCLYSTGAFPFDDDYLTSPVCAYYFISCWPKPGCCVPPPRSKALEKLLNPGLERIEALDMVAPGGEDIDRAYRERPVLACRKNSNDGMELV